MSNGTRLYDEIPSLDLADFTSGDATKKQEFVNELGEAYNNIGFVAIKGHALTNDMQESLYSEIKAFFALPDDAKQQYEFPELAGQRGYVSKGKEKAKGHSTGDLKEFFHVGQEVPAGNAEGYPENIWPSQVPNLKNAANNAFRALEATGITMLRALALYLGLPENYFDDKVSMGNSILRPIHYFPIPNPDAVPANAVRAAEHGDINLITLLMGASADGLQVKRRDGQWIPITALPEQLVVNVGDMLDRLTNHKLKSTIHRVVNPPREKMGTSRFSIPFFMHPKATMDLTCLESCIDEDNPKRYPDMTAGAFLEERLIELGLLKK